jgi:hypothetical protein
MLRHIISVSLAMTACAALIPTKADAAILTITPVGSLQKRPGESITFIFSLNPQVNPGVIFRKSGMIDYDIDTTELSFDPQNSFEEQDGFQLTTNTDIARLTFTVLRGVVKDGQSDLFNAFTFYQIGDENPIIAPTPHAEGSFDVEPVPEPLTMLGAAAALGYGAILKRKSSKKTVS